MIGPGGWYLWHQGRRLMAGTKAEARRLARRIADKTGKPVTVRPFKSAARARKMKANPDPLHFLPAMVEQERARKSRLEYVGATKARRLAKGLSGKGRGQKAIRAAEAGAKKSARFVVEAKNRREVLTLYRPSRSAADQLAGEFLAAGYTVRVSEVP